MGEAPGPKFDGPGHDQAVVSDILEGAPVRHDLDMAGVPELTKMAVSDTLVDYAAQHWPQLSGLTVRFRGNLAYVSATLPQDTEPSPLCRLRWTGQPDQWGFGLYLYSSSKYEDQILPSGSFTGTAQQALDCACTLYLSSPSG